MTPGKSSAHAGSPVTVTTEGLIKRYRSMTVGPISATFSTGVTCVVGANGEGKSTLIRMLAGVLRPSGGTTTLRQGSAGVGYLAQDLVLPREARVGDYVRYVDWLAGGHRADFPRRLARTLHLVELDDRVDQRIRTLSGGERQRAGLAGALVHGPPVLLLDEPTVGLDATQRSAFHRALEDIREHVTIIMATHVSEDLGVADCIMSMSGGQIQTTITDAKRALPAGSNFSDAMAQLLRAGPQGA